MLQALSMIFQFFQTLFSSVANVVQSLFGVISLASYFSTERVGALIASFLGVTIVVTVVFRILPFWSND